MPALKPLLLAEPRLTLAVAESLTCGRLQALIGQESGASAYFLGGITAYALAQKARHLGVDPAQAEPVNAVSAAVAEQMARGVCALFAADVGLATTGYAEPAAGVAHPYAWWAVAHRAPRGDGFVSVRSGRIECPGASRVEAQQGIAEAALAELAAYLATFRQG